MRKRCRSPMIRARSAMGASCRSISWSRMIRPNSTGRVPTSGTQYRSAIFPMNDEQAQVAKAYIAQLDGAKVFGAPVVTTIEPGKTFYRAEDYHQDFLAKNPGYPYIVYNDLPKVANLKRLFPALYRPTRRWSAPPALKRPLTPRGEGLPVEAAGEGLRRQTVAAPFPPGRGGAAAPNERPLSFPGKRGSEPLQRLDARFHRHDRWRRPLSANSRETA